MATPKSPYDLAYGQDPLPLSRIPEIFSPAIVGDTASVEEIRQRISYYLFCIDGKAFEHLGKVFANDATAYYSEPLGHLNGLESIQSTMKEALVAVELQHLQSTQYVLRQYIVQIS